MDLHEYQAKQIMRDYKLPVSEGFVVQKQNKDCQVQAQEVDLIEKTIKQIFAKHPMVVVKAQVHAGGRGKAGGVKLFTKEREELAIDYAKNLLGKQLVTHQTNENGQFISAVYFELGCDIERELYLSMIVNREHNCISIIASTEGGMDIEEVSEHNPEKIHTININPITGYQAFYAKQLCFLLNLDLAIFYKGLNSVLGGLYKMMIEKDVSLLEVNPLVITKQNSFIILDAKVSIDDNANWRQKEIFEMRDPTQESDLENQAKAANLSYVKLDGNIGCMVNGAGLAMATMDIIQYYGGSPANFLDVGGGASKDGVKTALEIILKDADVKAVLINIFGGIVRCDMIAEAVVAAITELKNESKQIVPVVVRLSGTNSELGSKIISEAGLGLIAANDLAQAAQKAVDCLK